MTTLKTITETINTLKGDLTFDKIKNKNLNFLAIGRRADHDFVVRTNMRTLRSGPNRGKIRVNGAIIVMFGNRNRNTVRTAIVTSSAKFLETLDKMAKSLTNHSE